MVCTRSRPARPSRSATRRLAERSGTAPLCDNPAMNHPYRRLHGPPGRGGRAAATRWRSLTAAKDTALRALAARCASTPPLLAANQKDLDAAAPRAWPRRCSTPWPDAKIIDTVAKLRQLAAWPTRWARSAASAAHGISVGHMRCRWCLRMIYESRPNSPSRRRWPSRAQRCILRGGSEALHSTSHVARGAAALRRRAAGRRVHWWRPRPRRVGS